MKIWAQFYMYRHWGGSKTFSVSPECRHMPQNYFPQVLKMGGSFLRKSFKTLRIFDLAFDYKSYVIKAPSLLGPTFSASKIKLALPRGLKRMLR